METLGALSGLCMQQDCQKGVTTLVATSLVPSTLIHLHLSPWKGTTSVSQLLVQYLKTEYGTLMTLCGTHREVKVGALAAVMHDGPWFTTSLRQEVSDDIEVRWCFNEGSSIMKTSVWNNSRYMYSY